MPGDGSTVATGVPYNQPPLQLGSGAYQRCRSWLLPGRSAVIEQQQARVDHQLQDKTVRGSRQQRHAAIKRALRWW